MEIVWNEPMDKLLVAVVADAVQEERVALREYGGRQLGRPLGGQDQAKPELAPFAGDALEDLTTDAGRILILDVFLVAFDKGMRLLHDQHRGQGVPVQPHIALQRLEDHTSDHGGYHVNDLGWHKRQVDHRHATIIGVVASDVIGQPCVQRRVGRAAQDRLHPAIGEQRTDSDQQRFDMFGYVEHLCGRLDAAKQRCALERTRCIHIRWKDVGLGASEGRMCLARRRQEVLNLLTSEVVVWVLSPARSAQLLELVGERLQPGLLILSEGTPLKFQPSLPLLQLFEERLRLWKRTPRTACVLLNSDGRHERAEEAAHLVACVSGRRGVTVADEAKRVHEGRSLRLRARLCERAPLGAVPEPQRHFERPLVFTRIHLEDPRWNHGIVLREGARVLAVWVEHNEAGVGGGPQHWQQRPARGSSE